MVHTNLAEKEKTVQGWHSGVLTVPGLEAICGMSLLWVNSFLCSEKKQSLNSNSIWMQALSENHHRVSGASWVNSPNYYYDYYYDYDDDDDYYYCCCCYYYYSLIAPLIFSFSKFPTPFKDVQSEILISCPRSMRY